MPRDLVLVHGGLYNATCWDRVVAVLAADASSPFGRVSALDVPGSGTKRGRDLSGLTRDDLVAELNGEVRAAGFAAPVLAGHAIAGTLLTEMARQEEYSALCFLCTPILEPGQVAASLFGTGVHGSDPATVGFPADPGTVTPREMNRLRFSLDLPDDFAEAWLDDCQNDAVPPALMNTPGRVLDPASLPPLTYIVATRSPVFPVEWQERFAARLGQAVRLSAIDSGHAPFLSHPRQLARLLCELYAG